MTAAPKMRPAAAPPIPTESGVGLIQVPREEPEFLDMGDVMSLRPEPMVERIPTLKPPDAEYAVLSLEAEGDDEVAALMASKGRSKVKGVLVCLAFPAVIGLVLTVVGGGEGRAKDYVANAMAPAISQGETIVSKIDRDAKDLEAARKEIADAQEMSKKEATALAKHKGKKRRGLP